MKGLFSHRDQYLVMLSLISSTQENLYRHSLELHDKEI